MKKEKGFSLIETLIYISLVVLVVGAVTTTTIWTLRVGSKTKITNEILANVQQGFNSMIFEIKKSASIYTPTSVFESNTGQISLKQKTEVLPDEEETFVDIFLCDNSLCLKREGSSPIKLTSDQVKITSLYFEQLTNSSKNPSIQIKMSIDSTDDFIFSEPIDFQTSINLRTY